MVFLKEVRNLFREVNKLDYPKGYFDAQVSFAVRWSELTDLSFTKALRHKTGVYYVLSGFETPSTSRSSSTFINSWERICEEITRKGNTDEIVDFLWFLYTKSPQNKFNSIAHKSNNDFGCFSFETAECYRSIRIHFFPTQRGRVSELSRSQAPSRQQELREMFGQIYQRYPNTEKVIGTSWLYNLPTYRACFPSSFTADSHECAPGQGIDFHLDSMQGQFVDRFGQGHEKNIRMFKENIRRSRSVEELLRAFPHPVLSVSDDIRNFYQFYGIS